MDTALTHWRLRAARFLAALLAALALPPATALDGPLAAECRVPGGATLLDAWPEGLPVAQQAVWLDGERLRWQAPEEAAELVLVAPAGGRSLAPGTRLADGDVLRRLGAVEAPGEVDARFSHVPGRVFRLDRPLEAADWEAPPLVAALDADGRVLAATGVQLAGALDAVFAPHAETSPLGATLAGGHTSSPSGRPPPPRCGSACSMPGAHWSRLACRCCRWRRQRAAAFGRSGSPAACMAGATPSSSRSGCRASGGCAIA
ncbi:MAG: hypothetical protein KatS3mg128_0415 [Silanimonas sp.]|nr:MAG: hypothetical protein KatS3mg128_0415 [Silanimonas sp.]